MKTKKELIASVAETTGTTKTSATAVVDAFIVELSNELLNGGGVVRINDFGTFKGTKTEAKENVKIAGKMCNVKAKNKVSFKLSKNLAEIN